jgi:formylglycine-generating enzyme required for sulfatase activity
MGAIFISYTGRDPVGEAWADRLSAWFREWNYGFFRDKDHSHGVKAGAPWRAALYRELGLAQAFVCLCSRQYDSSPWCVGELAIAVEKGKTVIPIQLLESREDPAAAGGNSELLPLLLEDRQVIRVLQASNPTPQQLEEVKTRLRESLAEKLNWRALQPWDARQAPYPGLLAFQETQAPVFFGQDGAIETVCERLTSLARRSPAFLLLLGASGYGKSSLVRAGVVPRLRAERDRPWLVVTPFSPGGEPFAALQNSLAELGGGGPAADPLRQLQSLQSARQLPVLLVIDQFEELLREGANGQPSEGERFLAFLETLLREPAAGLLVLATMRTDFLAPLQVRWPALTAMATQHLLEPIRPEDFGQLIKGPADRSLLTLQPGLKERLVSESGGGDALPLLAFTLEKLWWARRKRGAAVAGTRPGDTWDLTVEDYEHLGGVAGAVSHQAALCWNPASSDPADAAALREAFVDHLLSLNEEGLAAKRAARLADLPARSRPIVERLVNDRLLVSDDGVVEIAHEALLRTWQPLKGWIAESQEHLLQRRRVARLAKDLQAEAAPQRRQALEQLAASAAAGGSEKRAVRQEAAEALAALLAAGSKPEEERQDAAVVLALIGVEEPLRQGLADAAAPVALRRRAAECLGLLAKRSGDRDQRDRIAAELEGWLCREVLDVRIEVVSEPTAVAAAREAAQRKVATQVAQARASGQLGKITEAQLRQRIREAEEQSAQQELWAMGASPGWAEHDARLPLLQGASRGLQLAASADLPLLSSGPGQRVPMLTLTAVEEGSGLRIRSEVVKPEVWKLPLPSGEQLELVVVKDGEYGIGSPKEEAGRSVYSEQRIRQKCEGVDVEALRKVRLTSYAMVRHPISQAQWRAVVEGVAADQRGQMEASPSTFREEDCWERYGQPGALPVDSVNWNQCQQWLEALNGWLASQWPEWAEENPGLGSQAVQLALPSESQWEAACRAEEASSAAAPKSLPFHFGATLDPSWARYDATYTYGRGRRGDYKKRPVPIGFFGLVNRWGLAEMHGQLAEWCADHWHRSPIPADQRKRRGWFGGGGTTQALLDGSAMEGLDPGLAEVSQEQRMRLLRGGSWIFSPHYARAAFRYSNPPDAVSTGVGVRPGCFSPPGSLLGP